MEILVGRITADAKIATLKDERKVVNFSIAVNDSFKPKGSSEVKKVVRFVQCAYWVSESIAKHLTKGILIEVCGRISVNVWNDMQGEAKGSLKMHVNNIKLHGKSKSQKADNTKEKSKTVPVSDDLPF